MVPTSTARIRRNETIGGTPTTASVASQPITRLKCAHSGSKGGVPKVILARIDTAMIEMILAMMEMGYEAVLFSLYIIDMSVCYLHAASSAELDGSHPEDSRAL
jgi:hypothetical protein